GGGDRGRRGRRPVDESKHRGAILSRRRFGGGGDQCPAQGARARRGGSSAGVSAASWVVPGFWGGDGHPGGIGRGGFTATVAGGSSGFSDSAPGGDGGGGVIACLARHAGAIDDARDLGGGGESAAVVLELARAGGERAPVPGAGRAGGCGAVVRGCGAGVCAGLGIAR